MPPHRSQPCPACTTAGLDAEACANRPKCVICRGVTHLPAWGCCDGCIAGVDQQLTQILDLHALANRPAALTPATSGNAGPSAIHRDPPPPVSIDALDLAIGEHILGVLESWERWWREHFKLTPYGPATERLPQPHRPGNSTLIHVVGFLRVWWPQAAAGIEPPPDEFASEVRTLHRQAMNALSLSRFDLNADAEEPWDWALKCPRDVDDAGNVCGHRIGMRRQPLPVDGEQPEPLTLNCPRCGARWTVARLLLVAAASGTRIELSVNDAAIHLGVSRATVYRRGLVHRGMVAIGN